MDKAQQQAHAPAADSTRPGAARRPYRAPRVVSRPLFERMALNCGDVVCDANDVCTTQPSS